MLNSVGFSGVFYIAGPMHAVMGHGMKRDFIEKNMNALMDNAAGMINDTFGNSIRAAHVQGAQVEVIDDLNNEQSMIPHYIAIATMDFNDHKIPPLTRGGAKGSLFDYFAEQITLEGASNLGLPAMEWLSKIQKNPPLSLHPQEPQINIKSEEVLNAVASSLDELPPDHTPRIAAFA